MSFEIKTFGVLIIFKKGKTFFLITFQREKKKSSNLKKKNNKIVEIYSKNKLFFFNINNYIFIEYLNNN